MKPVYVTGIPGSSNQVVRDTLHNFILTLTDNFRWLSPGDIVLLKPALNSGDPYPATTHPLALEVTSRLLADRGATVVIGDQSGIGHELHHPGGVIRGKTHDNYILSGMARNNSSRFVSFEEEGWDEGFFHYSSPKTGSWKDGFFHHELGKGSRPYHKPSQDVDTQPGGCNTGTQDHGRAPQGRQPHGVPRKRAL